MKKIKEVPLDEYFEYFATRINKNSTQGTLNIFYIAIIIIALFLLLMLLV